MGFISIPSLVEPLISRAMVQTRRNKREEPGEKQRPEIICKMNNAYLENGGPNSSQTRDVSIFFQPLIPGPGFILPHRPSQERKKKHIHLVETSYLMSSTSHEALIFFFIPSFAPQLEVFLEWKASLKPSAFHSPSI